MTTYLKTVKYDYRVEPLHGEIECGDQYFVKEIENTILFAVIDGLGHGKEASHAAKIAIQTLDQYTNESIECLMRRCDQALLTTCGAVMMIATLDQSNCLAYMSIGNIIGGCWKRNAHEKLVYESFSQESGIVGSQLRSLKSARKMSLSQGDIFILATDGIKCQFEEMNIEMNTIERVTQRVFENYRNIKDDGLVLVGQIC